MKLGTVSQLILYVEDITSQLRFFTDIIGLKVTYPVYEDKSKYKDETWITFDTGDCVLALHAGGKGQIGTDAPKFNLEVEDLDRLKEILEKNGFKTGEIFSPIPGKRILLLHGLEGIMFYGVDHKS